MGIAESPSMIGTMAYAVSQTSTAGAGEGTGNHVATQVADGLDELWLDR